MRERTKCRGIIKLGENKYEIRVSKGYDPTTGKYPQHIEVFRGTLGFAAARQSDIRQEIKHERKNKPSDWSMSRLMEKYFVHRAGKGDSYNSLKTDRGRWEIMEPLFGERDIASVTPMDIDDLLNALAKTRHAKPQTINRYKSLLSGAFTQANHWHIVVGNPVKSVVSRKPVPFRKHLPSFEQIDFLIKAFERRINSQMGIFLQLTWLNSMRRAEACALRVENFFPSENLLTIDKVVVLKTQKDGGGWHLKHLKNGVIKEIQPLDKFSFEILTELASLRHEPSDFLFSDDGGKTPWPAARVTQSQRRIREMLCSKCGYVGRKYGTCPKCDIALGLSFRVHDLRGWMTTYLLRKGRDKAAQTRGGWKDQNVMRNFYYSLSPDEAESAASDIDELFMPGTAP